MQSTKKQKHLTIEKRERIETGLREGRAFKAIAAKIVKDPSTGSKKVLRHITVSKTSVRKINPFGEAVALEPCPGFFGLPISVTAVLRFLNKQFYRVQAAQIAYETLHSQSRKENSFEQRTLLSNRPHPFPKGETKTVPLSHFTNQTSRDFQLYRLSLSAQRISSISPLDLPRVAKLKPHRHSKPHRIPKALN